MQANLLWTGREYYSLENCLVNSTSGGSEITSTIIGKYNGKIYQVEYLIKTTPDWRTVRCEVKCQHDNRKERIIFESDGEGNWLKDGKPAEEFNGCFDVDIPLTPFTNTLPINRLKLTQNAECQIRVIYLDLLTRQIVAVKQKYTCLSKTEYHYENVPNDFEAKIKVDEQGFVVDYPSLFVRTDKLNSNYP